MENNPIESKICCGCKIEKPIKDFYRNKELKGGFENKCKKCKKKKISCRKVAEKKRSKPTYDQIMMFNVSKQDWIETYRALERIGYDLKQDLHLQFCKKHNLEPKLRTKEKSIYYSVKDLGLI